MKEYQKMPASDFEHDFTAFNYIIGLLMPSFKIKKTLRELQAAYDVLKDEADLPFKADDIDEKLDDANKMIVLFTKKHKETLLTKDACCYFAGGCFSSYFSNRKINDIDVFFTTPEELERAQKIFKKLSAQHIVYESFDTEWITNYNVPFSQNGYVVNYKVQFVKKFQEMDPTKMLEKFDFTIVKAAYDGEFLYYHKRFFMDLAGKRLVLNEELEKPHSTMERAFKYVGRGYSICPVGMSRLARNIESQPIDWENPDENVMEFYHGSDNPKFRGLD